MELEVYNWLFLCIFVRLHVGLEYVFLLYFLECHSYHPSGILRPVLTGKQEVS